MLGIYNSNMIHNVLNFHSHITHECIMTHLTLGAHSQIIDNNIWNNYPVLASLKSFLVIHTLRVPGFDRDYLPYIIVCHSLVWYSSFFFSQAEWLYELNKAIGTHLNEEKHGGRGRGQFGLLSPPRDRHASHVYSSRTPHLKEAKYSGMWRIGAMHGQWVVNGKYTDFFSLHFLHHWLHCINRC